MMAIARTLELLVLLSAVGLPFVLFLRSQLASRSPTAERGQSYLLEAPGLGLAILAIGASFVLATGGPVAAPWALGAIGGVIQVAWALAVWRFYPWIAELPRRIPRAAWRGAVEVAGLAVVL